MANIKKIMGRIIKYGYNIGALFVSLNLFGYWFSKVPFLHFIFDGIRNGQGFISVILKYIFGQNIENYKGLIVVCILMIASIFLEKYLIRLWDSIFVYLYKLSKKKNISFAKVKDFKFAAIYRVDQAVNRDTTSCILPLPNSKCTVSDIANSYIRKKITEGINIDIQSGYDISVSELNSTNAEPMKLTDQYSCIVRPEGNNIFMKVLSETHKVPIRSGKAFQLDGRDPFCKKFDGTWERVPLENQLWKCYYKNKPLYFTLEDHLGKWKATCVRNQQITVLEVEVITRSPLNRPNNFRVMCKDSDDGKIFYSELSYLERCHKQEYYDGHEQMIEAESDQMPCIVVGMFGYVGCGKTSFLAALSSNHAKAKMNLLTGYQYSGDELDSENIRRTMINEQKCIAFPIIDSNRKPRYIIYFLDLSGEITRRDTRLYSPESIQKERLLQNIGQLCDVALDVSDDRVIWNEPCDGDTNNVYSRLGMVKNLDEFEILCVCSKADKIKNRMVANPLTTRGTSIVPLVTEDSFAFESVADCITNDYISANMAMYSHMALAKEVMAGAQYGNLVRNKEKDKCFLVSAGTQKQNGDITTVDTREERNCELVLAYLMQMKFGISLKNEREISYV